MNVYPCRSCGKPKPAKQVMTKFRTYNSPVEKVRWRKCDDCRHEAMRSYRRKEAL